ncbi:NADH:flavin oxidoreductase [Rhizobium leguminosarum]|uniref:NADH:flavin oxidoreductase n=1 Tax=Rhizobium leguminosarum TaxID=384 RepID=UPI0013B8B71D|nr:NADH:flavin oxidoreductase [Rhizobium leguminosarum]MCA2435848.1 NADH:flavin oxidoreductase [Rhizobium leguminosarum]NEH73401.1 12-oxophytodienoate reductase [Rhizobium leguminosarum]
MSRSTDVLFTPFQLKSLSLANCIVMAPMTRAFTAEGVPGKANADYYRRRAEGGVGLILSEGTVIDRPASRNMAGIPFFHGDEALSGWKGVIDAVHSAGGRMGPQIWHTGSTKGPTDWAPASPVESPSGLLSPEEPRGKEMSEEDIADTIAAFAKAAADAKRLGFDTVEVRGAHGYLVDQFFWSGTNKRTDRWGGPSIKERSRFAAEVIKAIRASVGEAFPLILRISQWKQQDFASRLAETPDLMADWLQPLQEAGVDIFHCSQRRFWQPEYPEIDGEQGLNFAGWVKKLTGAATISVGSVGLSGDFMGAFAGEASISTDISNLLERLERNEFDLIAVGRALISDPEWPSKVRNGGGELKGFDAAALGELA